MFLGKKATKGADTASFEHGYKVAGNCCEEEKFIVN
jgi:hypothetical protein